MRHRSQLLALGTVMLGTVAAATAFAQANKTDKPYDFKPLIPPAFVLPPSSQINPGTVGGTETPYTTAPLQNSSRSTTQSSPGLKLTIPSRRAVE